MMSIKEFFEGVAKSNCPHLTNSVCEANSVQDFYDKCIKSNLPDVEVVKGWHELLKKYIDDPDSVFFVRRYTSGKDKAGNWDIRRGFLTEYNNISYVFVDNYFAQYFYAMAINGFVPDYTDFKNFMLNREMPYGYRDTSLERPHQAYRKGPEYPLNKNGWKLSHVFSANGNDYSFDYKAVASTLFPKGEYADFKIQGESTYPYRKIEDQLSSEDVKRIKAHFLRVVHPMNYFLTPKTKFQSSSVGIKDIGEYPGMIDYMKYKLARRYGSLFGEYQEMIMAPSFSYIGLKYGKVLSKGGAITIKPAVKSITSKGGTKPVVSVHKSTSKPKAKKLSFTNKEIADSIRAYLFDGKSYRKIEQTCLGLPKRTNGGGWDAKKLLEDNGINSSMKKAFDGKTIEEAISLSSEPLKSTLIWMDTNL